MQNETSFLALIFFCALVLIDVTIFISIFDVIGNVVFLCPEKKVEKCNQKHNSILKSEDIVSNIIYKVRFVIKISVQFVF